MAASPRKLLVTAISTGIALAAGYGAYRWTTRWRPTAFHQNAPEIERLLAERAALGDPVEFWSPIAPGSELRRHPIWEELVRALFPLDDLGTRYDEMTYFAWEPKSYLPRRWEEHPDGRFAVITNVYGMREDTNPPKEKADLRVIVTGDSHTDGVCFNRESWANRLEAQLAEQRPERSVEVMNAGRGGFSLYQYLGTLEKFIRLEPDVFIACVYGGNDFDELLTLHHLFARTVRPPGYRLYTEEVKAAEAIAGPVLSQAFFQLKYFAAQPEERDVAIEAAVAVVREMQRVCELKDIRLVIAYLPPMADVQADQYDGVVEALYEALELDSEQQMAVDSMATEFLSAVSELGVETVDLRAAFRAADEALYWNVDHHINLTGHELVARELLPLFDRDSSE